MPTLNPRVNVTFNPTDAEIMKLICEKKNISMSSLVRKVVEDWLEEYEDMELARRAEEAEKEWLEDGGKTYTLEEVLLGTRYRVEFTGKSKENLIKFPKNIQERIIKAIQERLPLAPEAGKPLVREWKNHRRLRVGDYRVIYKILEEKIVVLIVEIDNRRDIY